MSNDGVIKISKDVVLDIVGLAASDVEGVARVGGFRVDPLLQAPILSDSKGIDLQVDGNNVYVSLSIYVKPDYEIPEICETIQKNIVREVKNMTNLDVKEVNIEVVDIVR